MALTLSICKDILLARIGILYAMYMHMMHSMYILCVLLIHMHFAQFLWQILHQSWLIKYCKYRVIIVLKPEILSGPSQKNRKGVPLTSPPSTSGSGATSSQRSTAHALPTSMSCRPTSLGRWLRLILRWWGEQCWTWRQGLWKALLSTEDIFKSREKQWPSYVTL